MKLIREHNIIELEAETDSEVELLDALTAVIAVGGYVRCKAEGSQSYLQRFDGDETI